MAPTAGSIRLSRELGIYGGHRCSNQHTVRDYYPINVFTHA